MNHYVILSELLSYVIEINRIETHCFWDQNVAGTGILIYRAMHNRMAETWVCSMLKVS